MSGSEKYSACVVGAGPAGLAMAKNLAQHGIACDVYERAGDVGGVWNYANPNSPVYRSAHLISSKSLTEFADFPMPPDSPDFPGRERVWEYLKAYARHFDLYRHIKFHSEVVSIIRESEHSAPWVVTLKDGSIRRYRWLALATGVEWEPYSAEFPGTFSGTKIHSFEYREPTPFRDRVVLVVGGGNSGCDIAVDIAGQAKHTLLSMRRGYYFLPKYFLGKPADIFGELSLKLRLPLWFRRIVNTFLLNLTVGRPERFGFPTPDHRLLESHPLINSRIYEAVGHGRLTPKSNVARFEGRTVHFEDGTHCEVDAVIMATGYRNRYAFIDPQSLNWRDGYPQLYLHIFHPKLDDIAVLDLIKPDSGVWWMYDDIAHLVTHFWIAQRDRQPAADAFRAEKRGRAPDLARGHHYVKSPRHTFSVEHFSFGRRIRRKLREMGGSDCIRKTR
jgi:hypothetical protein